MTDPTILNNDQRDALAEIVNIGMGRAGEQLARVLGTFVELSIPQVEVTDKENLVPTITRFVQTDQELTCTRQAFFGHWRGEALSLFYQQENERIAHLMGYGDELNPNLETELKLDISNILVGACLNGIAHTLDTELKYSPPSLVAKRTYVEDILANSTFEWSKVLVMEVKFKLESIDFHAHLLITMADESIEILKSDLDKFLEAL